MSEEKNFMNNKIKEKENNIKLNEYINKIFYQFKEYPNLKFKLNITNNNDDFGYNDIFEVFISFKDNKEYLVSANKNNYKLDIFLLLDNKNILNLPGHNNRISTIRYFFNDKDYNEYLISADMNKIVIIWDITNNYNIKYKIDTHYKDYIFSCLLVFPHNSDDNFIITSSKYNNKYDGLGTNIYSLNDGKLIRFIRECHKNDIRYLLSWYNKKNQKYYIIQLALKTILINNLLENETYSELKGLKEDFHYCGFIYYENDKDYLCTSSNNGYINIWDLYEKKLFKVIYSEGSEFYYIIQWNSKFIIAADNWARSFKVISLEYNRIISDIKLQGNDGFTRFICIKKIKHPIFGESLLTGLDNNTIKLWTI